MLIFEKISIPILLLDIYKFSPCNKHQSVVFYFAVSYKPSITVIVIFELRITLNNTIFVVPKTKAPRQCFKLPHFNGTKNNELPFRFNKTLYKIRKLDSDKK